MYFRPFLGAAESKLTTTKMGHCGINSTEDSRVYLLAIDGISVIRDIYYEIYR